MHDFSQLPIPFACVATDLVTGEPVVLKRGSLPEAMMASMAVPSVFSPVKLDGRLLVDGGVVRSVPAQDVVAMGADMVMVSMVSQQLLTEEDLSNVLSILAQSLTYQVASSNRKQLEYADLVIQPDLGPLLQTDFQAARVIIQQGEIEARKQLAEIRWLKMKHVPVHRTDQPSRVVVDSVYVSAFRIEGLDLVGDRVVIEELDLKLPGYVSAKDLSTSINRLYSTGLFSRVSYAYEDTGDGGVIAIQVVERRSDELRLGLRFDQDEGAVILLNTHLRNLWTSGSELNFDVRVGDRFRIDTRLFEHSGLARALGWTAQAYFQQYERPMPSAGRKVRVPIDTKELHFELGVGSMYGSRIMTTFAIGGKTIVLPSIGDLANVDRSYAFGTAIARLWMDKLDRASYPTRGNRLQAMSDWSHDLGRGKSHTRHLFNYMQLYRYGPTLSFWSDVTTGFSTGKAMPLFREFYAGGLNNPLYMWGGEVNFAGIRTGQISGRNLQALEFGFQYQPFPKRYVRGSLGAIRATANYTIPFYGPHYDYTARIALAAETRFGPIELALMGGTPNPLLIGINVGHRF